jgi:hypothetical protein
MPQHRTKLMAHFEARDKSIHTKLAVVYGNIDEIYELSQSLMDAITNQFKQAPEGDAPPLAETIIHWSVCASRLV